MMVIKYCPLLVVSETKMSLTVYGESYKNTWMKSCCENDCAAFKNGNCAMFNTRVSWDAAERPDDK